MDKQVVTTEEIIYYRLIELEDRLDQKAEQIIKATEILEESLQKAEAILLQLQKLKG